MSFTGDLMGSQGKIPLQEGLRVRDLKGGFEGKLGEVCDLMRGILCGNSTLKGISWGEWDHKMRGHRRRGIT